MCILCIVFFPYLNVELLSLRYGELFECTEFEMVDDISYCKVMRYEKEQAQVLYVCKDKLSILVEYEKDNDDEWKAINWKCVWSSSGTADGFIWPFYR